MCIDKAGNITEKTFKNCVDLVAYLLKKYGLTTNDIWTHKGIVGWKDCPLPWIKNPSEFERFKREVGKILQPVVVKEEEPKMNKTDAEKIIAFLGAGWNVCKDKASQDEFKRLADEIRKVAGIEVK